MSLLPQRVQFLIGRIVGLILFKFLDERREIAHWNIKKCFPEKDVKEIDFI